MKKQVFYIKGGFTHNNQSDFFEFIKSFEVSLDWDRTKRWGSKLQERLGENYDVIIPQMPNDFDAKYDIWKIWFEKYLNIMDDQIILIGHSLGAIFLAKYFSNNTTNKNILSMHLIGTPALDESKEPLTDFKIDPSKLSNISKQTSNIHLYHSKDDPVIDIAELDVYTAGLPNAKVHVFEDRGHFNNEEFPELIEDIKNAR